MNRRLVVPLIASFATACTIVNGLHLPEGADPEPDRGDGSIVDNDGRVVGTSSSSGDGGACNLRHPPSKPVSSGASTEKGFVVALQQTVATNEGPAFGFDLDNLCTCPGKEACKSNTPHCDANDNTGKDNTGSGVFNLLKTNGINIIDESNALINDGVYGVVYQVDGYNGLANDDAIEVTVYRSRGISSGPNFGVVQQWPVGPTPTKSTSAWVANKTLVANFASLEVTFLGSTIKPAHVTTAVISGAIVDGAAGPTMAQATIAGRAETGDLIQSVGEVYVRSIGTALCQVPPFTSTASGVCAAQDLPLNPAEDGKDGKCEALAFASSVILVPAEVGSRGPIPAADEQCDGVEPVVCH